MTRGRPRWTLRTRLLASLIAMLVVVCGIVGVVSVLSLRGFLLGQLDDQLRSAVSRSENASGKQGPHPGKGPEFLVAPGQAAGTLGARLRNGEVDDAAVLDNSGEPQSLPDSESALLTQVPVDGKPHTMYVEGLGDYRLIATKLANGDVLVTGLPLAAMQDAVWRLASVVTGIAVIGLVLAGVGGTIIIRYTLRPLRRVADTATRVSQLPLDRGEVALAERVPPSDTDPRTEVGQVGGALNLMLDHIDAALSARHASETRVRQFVADASHELRTPLAAIRGYAELTRRSREQLPDDIVHAMRRVESETSRMTGLVEDLLLLARLDSGPALELREVDLSRLVVDAVSDAHVAGRDHHWHLEVPDDPVTVSGDPQRLHQVLANLLSNARTHTPPGTTVTVGLRPLDVHIELRVADDGPGIPPDLLPDVFARFARGDSSRSRAAGSTGLGLAIVAAVVEAHNGTVSVDSTPNGTCFTITLVAGTRHSSKRSRG